MVQSYSPGGNVYSHKSTLAPPGEYDWTCASFGPLESTTQTANRSVQPFCTAHGRKSLHFTVGASILQNCPFPWGSGSPSNTCFLGPSQPTTQTAPRSVHPFLHVQKRMKRSRCRYTLQRFAAFPQNYPFQWGSGPLENVIVGNVKYTMIIGYHVVRA